LDLAFCPIDKLAYLTNISFPPTQVVADRVPQLLLAAAKSLRLQYDASKSSALRAQLEAVRAFAGNTGIHYKFPAAAYQELARLCMV
jgi:hypothetical protein